METISSYMEKDHKRCDEFFAEAEQAASKSDWERAKGAFEQFRRAIDDHFSMEEKELFPALEQAAGGPMGPTQVMRMEHDQMRGLFAEMEEALAAKDEDAFLGAAETLLILMQQHNAKEEQIVYPLSDQLLENRQDEVLEQMQSLAKA